MSVANGFVEDHFLTRIEDSLKKVEGEEKVRLSLARAFRLAEAEYQAAFGSGNRNRLTKAIAAKNKAFKAYQKSKKRPS